MTAHIPPCFATFTTCCCDARATNAAEEELGSLGDAFTAGDFRSLRHWLLENVHRHAQRYTAARIVQGATGSAPDPSALIESLSTRYQTAL